MKKNFSERRVQLANKASDRGWVGSIGIDVMQAVFPAVVVFESITPNFSWFGQIVVLLLVFLIGVVLFLQGVSNAERDGELSFSLLLAFLILAGLTMVIGKVESPTSPVFAPVALLVAFAYARLVRKLDGYLSVKTS